MTNLKPAAAHLQIVERHDGEKYDSKTPVKPNLLRVNGIPLWCSAERGITIDIDGHEPGPVVATLRLLARSLRIGGATDGAEPAPPAPADERPHFARIEVPGLPRDVQAGDEIDAPYVVIDGHPLLVRGRVGVEEVRVGEDIVTVDVPLVCRSIVFDDEVTSLASV